MKQAEVMVGGTYMTKISGGLGKVRVIERTTNHDGRTVYKVARLETPDRVMERTAAALRPEPKLRLKPGLTNEQLSAAVKWSPGAAGDRVREAAQAELDRRAARWVVIEYGPNTEVLRISAPMPEDDAKADLERALRLSPTQIAIMSPAAAAE
jgi:hypothetical protein